MSKTLTREFEKLPPRGAQLFELVKDLDAPFGFERSFKMQENRFYPNRILFSVGKLDIGAEPEGKIIDICHRLQMPSELLPFARGVLGNANIIHFGYEEHENGSIYKTYFEYEASYRDQREQARETLRSIHLCSAVKWDTGHPARHTITEYTVYPALSRAQRLERMRAIYSNINNNNNNNNNALPLRLAAEIMALASRLIPEDDIFYLEAKEATNPRTSFDINIYNAELTMETLQGPVMELADYYSLDKTAFTDFFTTIKHKTFGHLSSGIDRNGKDFFSIYYGVEGYR